MSGFDTGDTRARFTWFTTDNGTCPDRQKLGGGGNGRYAHKLWSGVQPKPAQVLRCGIRSWRYIRRWLLDRLEITRNDYVEMNCRND